MKKLISLMLVLTLCLSVAAVAGAVPSKSTADLTNAEVTLDIENEPNASGAFITPVVIPDPAASEEEMTEEEKEEFEKQQEQYRVQIDICDQEISKLVSLVQAEKDSSLEKKVAEIGDAAEGEEIELDEAEVAAAQTAAIGNFFTEVRNVEGEHVTVKQVLGIAEEEEAHLDVTEFCPIVAGGFGESTGKVVANMSFATTYEKDEKVAVLIGIVTVLDDGTTQIVWTALEGFGQDDGSITVELPPEVVLAVQDEIAIMSVVRNVTGK